MRDRKADAVQCSCDITVDSDSECNAATTESGQRICSKNRMGEVGERQKGKPTASEDRETTKQSKGCKDGANVARDNATSKTVPTREKTICEKRRVATMG